LARWAALGALLSTLLALGIRLFMHHPQVNNQELAVALPLWLGAVIAALLATPRPSAR
jgi:hypothetical protein